MGTNESQSWDTDLEKIRLYLFQSSWNNLSLTPIHHKQLPWHGNYFCDASACLAQAEAAENTEFFRKLRIKLKTWGKKSLEIFCNHWYYFQINNTSDSILYWSFVIHSPNSWIMKSHRSSGRSFRLFYLLAFERKGTRGLQMFCTSAVHKELLSLLEKRWGSKYFPDTFCTRFIAYPAYSGREGGKRFLTSMEPNK